MRLRIRIDPGHGRIGKTCQFRIADRLYYIEGYATGEIAAILEMPQNTVLSQLARARKLLKTALKGEFDDV